MFDGRLLAFAGFATLLALTPGVDTLLVLRNTLRSGRRAGLRTIAGVTTGLCCHATAAVLGLSALLATSAVAFTVVKAVAAAYLLWLGVQAFRRAGAEPDAPERLRGNGSPYRQGLLTNLLNPKVALFFLTVIPQFLRRGDDVPVRTLLYAVVFAGIGVLWLLLVTVAVGRLRVLVERPRVRRIVDRATGSVLVGFGVRVAVEAR